MAWEDRYVCLNDMLLNYYIREVGDCYIIGVVVV